MKNLEIAKLFFEIAEMLELLGVPFKPRAYQRAARSIESLSEDIQHIATQKKLLDIPGIGRGLSEKIEEYLQTGTLKFYKELKKKLPMDVEELGKVQGMGPKRIKLLYDKLKIKNLKDLKKAAELHKIQKIKGLGEKVEQDILKGIAFAKKNKGRQLIGVIIPLVEELKATLKKLKEVTNIEIAGSYRRKCATIGDIDILVTSENPEKVMDYFTTMKSVGDILAHGKKKSAVRLHNGIQVDLRVVKEREFGSALQYFTGSKEHNVVLRQLALKKGLTLNEYGLFTLKGKRWIAGKTEKDIYKKIGVLYIPPEMRENQGELNLKKLPQLIEYGDARGDFQTHTVWSDGQDNIEVMAKAAQKLGWQFITITDHVGQVGITNPLNEKRLAKQALEIKKLNEKLGIKIFHGAEVDIKKDGTLALSKTWQKKLDVVLASVHLATKMSSSEMTARITKALENNRIHILGHPTGRLLNQRDSYPLDYEKLFCTTIDTETFIDIDCHPERMDLPDVHVKQANDMGCRFVLSTDSHAKEQLHHLLLGEGIARRGWVEKKSVLNTHTIKTIENVLNKK